MSVSEVSIIVFSAVFLTVIPGCLAAEDILSDPNCLSCLCQIVSNSTTCALENCKKDINRLQKKRKSDSRTKSCGPFNLDIEYWTVCGKPELNGDSDEVAFQRCAMNPDCAKKCVQNYIKKFEKSCSGKPNCQMWSRIHFGGENGCNRPVTLSKWDKVNACLNSKTGK